MTAASSSVLTQPLLDRCRERAPGYDRDNTFCLEDFNELKAAGYLKMAIPKEFGGPGHEPSRKWRAKRVCSRSTRQPRRCALTCTTIGSAPRPTSGAEMTNPASGSLKMLRRARCSRRATPNTVTTSRRCSRRRKRSASMAATSSLAGRLSAALPQCGRGSADTPWTQAIQRRRRLFTSFCRATRKAIRLRKRGT